VLAGHHARFTQDTRFADLPELLNAVLHADLLVSRRALQRFDDRPVNAGMPALGWFSSDID
jgi:hypothetical protein